MTNLIGKQTITIIIGWVLSTAALGGAVGDRTVIPFDRQTARLEQEAIRGGSVLLDDRVLTTNSRHLLKIRDWDHRADRRRHSHRGRDSHRGKGHGHRRHDYSYRHHGRGRHGKHHYYRSDRHYRRHHHHGHRYGYDKEDLILLYGLGVLTPYLLDDY